MINEGKYHKKEIEIMEKGLRPSTIFKTFLRAQHSDTIIPISIFDIKHKIKHNRYDEYLFPLCTYHYNGTICFCV